MKHSLTRMLSVLISMTNIMLLPMQAPTHVPLKNDALKVLILETEGKDRYSYRNTEVMAKNVGFTTDFRNFYQWLEKPSLANYQTIICFLSGTFLKHKETPLVQRVFTSLKDFSSRKDTNLVLLFPGGNSNPENLAPRLESFCRELGIIDCTQQSDETLTTKAFMRFCLRPDSKVGFTYNSTLINQTNPSIEPWQDPRMQAGQQVPERTLPERMLSEQMLSEQMLPESQLLELQLLPSNRESFSAKASLFLPAGLLLLDQHRNKVTLLAKESTFNFADIEENFFRCPIHYDDRNELLNIEQHLLWDFRNACSPSTALAECPVLPGSFSPLHIKANKLRVERETLLQAPEYRWIAKGDCSAGWLAPDDYHVSGEKFDGIPEETRTALKKKALSDGIAFLYDTDINLLWFELNAENFLSKLVRSPEKEAALTKLFQPVIDELIRQRHINGKPLPKVFIGTDITCNFRHTRPQHSVVNLFGTVYSKIPSPLERTTYWEQELLEVFDAFCDLFEKTIPIDGIFLDFEMYHAQDQAGGYDNFMDFSDTSWQIFCKQREQQNMTSNVPSSSATEGPAQNKNNPTHLVSTEERVNFLCDNHLFSSYFTCLEQEAHAIGSMIKNHLRARLPNLMIGAYATTLPGSWFYRGMFAGLSDKQHPLILATFNMDAYSHLSWMNRHNIYYLHGVPLLLSKLATPEDAALIDYFTTYHSFIWFSRPSLIVYDFEKHKDDWWSVEASKLNRDTQVSMLKKARKMV